MRPHPTNPHGVIVQCADCDRDLHIPRSEYDRNPTSERRCVPCGAAKYLGTPDDRRTTTWQHS